jgi:hypothetical protein
MSNPYYMSDSRLRGWAQDNLKRYLDPREYTLIFDRLHSEKRSERMTRIELGLLKLMLDDYRPERSEKEQKAYAESNAVNLVEIADTLGCHVSAVRRAKSRLNDLAKRSEREGQKARSNGLILFHDMGVCIRATFWDALRAHDYSKAQQSGVTVAHTSNIHLADEKRHGINVEKEQLEKFAALTPVERARLLDRLAPAPA